jgi:hypothetical protein
MDIDAEQKGKIGIIPRDSKVEENFISENKTFFDPHAIYCAKPRL